MGIVRGLFALGVGLFPAWAACIMRFVTGRTGARYERTLPGELFTGATVLSTWGLGTAMFDRDMQLPAVALASTGLLLLMCLSGGMAFVVLGAGMRGTPPLHQPRLRWISMGCAAGAGCLAFVVYAARGGG